MTQPEAADHDPITRGTTGWKADAACSGQPIEWWFPTDDYGREQERLDPRAVAICDGCPVHAQCREHAMAYEKHGTWAGMTAPQRSSTRRRRRLTAYVPTVEGAQLRLL